MWEVSKIVKKQAVANVCNSLL